MSEEVDWQKLAKDLDDMEVDPAFQRVQPLLEVARSVIGAQKGGELATGLLAAAKTLATDVQKGAFQQPNWSVETVIQAANVNINLEPVQNALKQILLRLADLRQVVYVDVALVVMTAPEALALDNGSALANESQSLQQEFASLKNYFVSQQVTNWTSRYGNTVQEWKPFEDTSLNTRSIEQLVNQELQSIRLTAKLRERLEPLFHGIHDLATDLPRLELLLSGGCLVVIDAVSLRHPQVLRDLQKTHLDISPKSSVFVVAPWDRARTLIEGMTYALEVTLRDSALRWRIDNAYQSAKCHEIQNSRGALFKREFNESVRTLYATQLKDVGILSHVNKV